MNKIKDILILSFFVIIFGQLQLFSQSTFSKERIIKAIESYVQANSQCETRTEIEQAIRDFSFPQDNVKAEFSHTDELRGKTKLTLNFKKNNEVVGSNTIRLHVFCYAKYPVTTKFIPKGETIKATDIEIAKVDITHLAAPIITQKEEAVGKVARTGIVKGDPIKFNDLLTGKEVAIKRGAKVNLLHYSGAILIKSKGTALQDGVTGDIIKVKKDNANTLYGFIAEDGNIIIEKKEDLEQFLQVKK